MPRRRFGNKENLLGTGETSRRHGNIQIDRPGGGALPPSYTYQ